MITVLNMLPKHVKIEMRWSEGQNAAVSDDWVNEWTANVP